jgi:hypothetical protein
MWDFSVGKALGAVIRTTPFIVLRLAVYLGIGLAYLFTIGVGALVGTGIVFIGSHAVSGAIWVLGIAFIFAWALKAAILEPFALAALMQVYFKTVEGQTPDPVWSERLSSASARFRELAGKAAGWAPKPAPNAPSTITRASAT